MTSLFAVLATYFFHIVLIGKPTHSTMKHFLKIPSLLVFFWSFFAIKPKNSLTPRFMFCCSSTQSPSEWCKPRNPAGTHNCDQTAVILWVFQTTSTKICFKKAKLFSFSHYMSQWFIIESSSKHSRKREYALGVRYWTSSYKGNSISAFKVVFSGQFVSLKKGSYGIWSIKFARTYMMYFMIDAHTLYNIAPHRSKGNRKKTSNNRSLISRRRIYGKLARDCSIRISAASN